MPRSNERRTKGEGVEEEFPFLARIISPETLERILAETSFSGFLVRVMREGRLFDLTGEAGTMETWVAYNSPSLPPGYAEKLPEAKPLWEVFPYNNEKPYGPKDRKFVAVIQVHMRTYDDELKGLPVQIIVRKMPKGPAEFYSFERTLQGIRQLAGWPHWKIHNHRPE